MTGMPTDRAVGPGPDRTGPDRTGPDRRHQTCGFFGIGTRTATAPGPFERPPEEAHPIMSPMTRQEIEILLDTPDRRDYVVSAYADMTAQDGFNRYLELHLKNQARAAGEALAVAKARKDLDANI